MKIHRHGLTIGIERINEQVCMTMKPIGKLTHADYEMITPMLENVLNGLDKPHIAALVDATELDGWELRAAWDDLRLGLKHGNEFGRIAVVGNKRWERIGTAVSKWFTSGEVKYFEGEHEAIAWLNS